MALDAKTVLDSVAGYTQATTGQPPRLRLATIDPSYPGGVPRVTFDAEPNLSQPIPVLSSYTPVANDRVVVAPFGGSYVILGAVAATTPVPLYRRSMIFSGQPTITSGTWTTLTSWSDDTGSPYPATGGIGMSGGALYAPVTGIYQVTLRFAFDSDTTGNLRAIRLAMGTAGTVVAASGLNPGGSNSSQLTMTTGVEQLRMTAGTYVVGQAFNNVTDNWVWPSAAAGVNRFSMRLIQAL